jgi:hypothetical protein
MPQELRKWDGKEWQEHMLSLLRIRYGVRDFQALPDNHGGDFGLEGYSTDGCAYQCYAPQEPLSTYDRYVKHRDKITEDIVKFAGNRKSLSKVFGRLKISRWILLVPEHDSAQLNQHAETKAAEVRSKNLPYVARNFRIHIGSDKDFTKERQVLFGNGATQLRLPLQPIQSAVIDEWATAHADLIETLTSKLKKIPNLQTPEQVEKFRAEFLRHYLAGENLLSLLHEQYPEVFERIHKCKSDRENFLATDSLLIQDTPNKLLADILQDFTSEIENTVKGLDKSEVRKIAYSSIADWLLRCPLDFPSHQ